MSLRSIKKYLVALILNLIFRNFLHAQNLDQTIEQQDWITRQQQNQLEQEYRKKEQENIKKQRDKKSNIFNNNQSEINNSSDQCFVIKTIELIDANSLSKRQQKKLLSNFITNCIEANTLSKIINVIQTYYHNKGYITARVVIPKQNIQSGNLQLKIIEGKIQEIIINQDKFIDRMQEITAFGLIEGKILNLNDLNQGIYQLNRIHSNNASMKIQPSDNDGEAKILITNQKKFPAKFSTSYDNLGNNFTGIKRTNFSTNLENFFKLNDDINFSYNTNLNDDNKIKDMKSFSSSISIPFGYYTLAYDYSYSKFLGTNSGINGKMQISGYSARNNISIDRVIFNHGNFRLTSNFSISTKSSASYLNKIKIETSQRKLTIGNIAITISNYFKNGINLYLKPSYSKGLKILNAMQDQSNISAQNPKAQFENFKLYGSLSKKITISTNYNNFELPLVFTSEMDSQFSRQSLFGTEQFSVGGYHSVRGFRENYINGDSGYYLRNKINLNLGSLLKNFYKSNIDLTEIEQSKLNNEDKHELLSNNKNSAILINNYQAILNKISFEPFFDYGYVKNNHITSKADGRLTGTGLKTIYNGKYFNLSLTYSKAINKSQLINSNIKENKLIYFEIIANCCR